MLPTNLIVVFLLYPTHSSLEGADATVGNPGAMVQRELLEISTGPLAWCHVLM